MPNRTGLLMLLALFTAGCGILDPEGRPKRELEDNRDRWESYRPAAYAFVEERHCFCGLGARGPVRVLVRGTIPTERTYTATGEPVSAELAPFFPTIDGLFAVLADAYARGADEVRVTYDERTGIPTDIWIDYRETMADEEVGFTVTMPIDENPGS